MNRFRKTEKGFTLVELMIVIAIIGILAAIAIPQFAAYRQRGFMSAMQADCASIRTAEEAYFADNNTYTTTVADLSDFGFKNFSDTNSAVIAAGATGTITDGFSVTVSSTSYSGASVAYDSTTGATTSTKP